jgi:hypothetical protein
MKPQLAPEDIGLYLQYVVTSVGTPRAGRDGRLLLCCPVRSQPPHDILMDPQTGQWQCLGGTCGRGDIFDYHCIKFKLPGQRQAENAVVNVIRETQKKIRQADEAIKAARYATVEGCAKSVKSLLRLIDRHASGISRRDFQQKAHLSAQQFRKAVRELERRSLMKRERQKRAGRTARIIYFPVALAPGGKSEVSSAEAETESVGIP